jgi:hypothetical protein
MHTFEPKDPIEVITPHGPGIVIYVTVYGPHANDIWCIATKADGQLRHYQTIQVQLAESGVLNMNEKSKEQSSEVPVSLEDIPAWAKRYLDMKKD